MESVLEFVRIYVQSPAITLTHAELLLFTFCFGLLLVSDTRSRFSLLNTKNDIINRQHDELEKRREYIEAMEKKLGEKDKLIRDLSSAAVIHRVVFDLKDKSPLSEVSAKADPSNRSRH